MPAERQEEVILNGKNSAALDAVKSLAALVDELRQGEPGMVTISRDEYDSLYINQYSPDDIVVAVPESATSFFADTGNTVAISREQRAELLREASIKPARLLVNFDRFPHEHDTEGYLFSGTELALRNMDCVRVYAPPAYSKELVVKSLREIADLVERDWESLRDPQPPPSPPSMQAVMDDGIPF